MEQKTALRELINHIGELKEQTTDQSESYMLTTIWTRGVMLLELERDQNNTTFAEGYAKGWKDANQYLEEAMKKMKLG